MSATSSIGARWTATKRKLALGGLLAIALIAACDCPWGSICDDFPCDHDFISVAVGETKAVSVPFCPPWGHTDAVYEASSADTTIATVIVDEARDLLVTGKRVGQTVVGVWATLERIDGDAEYFRYDVTVYESGGGP